MDPTAFTERFDQLLAEETAEPHPGLWWLSFIDPAIAATIPEEDERPGGPAFLGVIVVEAPGFMHAMRITHWLGINPGGQVQGTGPFPPEACPIEYQNRLLTVEEATEIGQLP